VVKVFVAASSNKEATKTADLSTTDFLYSKSRGAKLLQRVVRCFEAVL